MVSILHSTIGVICYKIYFLQLSEWWNDIYMTYRDPLPYFFNFGGMSDYSAIWKPEKGTQVFRMSLMLCTVLEKHLMIQRFLFVIKNVIYCFIYEFCLLFYMI